MSYRLTSDLIIQTELSAMEKQLSFIHSELVHDQNNDINQPFQESVKWLIDKSENTGLYVNIIPLKTVTDKHWQLAKKISNTNLQELLAKLPDVSPNDFGEIKSGDNNYLWYRFSGSDFKILLITETTALDKAMVYVSKRLLLVSAIVLWLVIWLALAMSTQIIKRVESKNKQLAKMATHDSLTGLPNRLYLEEQLNQDLLNVSNQDIPMEGCLFMIDLDKFKEVNDSFGHSAGDFLLKEVAKRLTDLLTSNQLLVRVGGDEFIIWAPQLTIEDAQIVAKQLVKECDEPIMINKLAVNTGASIGIAHYPSQANTIEMLIVCADTAMYKAKQMHIGWHLFDELNIQDYKNRLSLRSELNDALLERQIKLHYQPKLALQTSDIVGVEALARWHHPQKGILSPFHFIELIEQSGRVQEFGRYIIRLAIEQLAQWKELGITMPIAVNLSPYNLLDLELVDFIQQLLNKYDVSANQLEIELTENETSLNIDIISVQLEKLSKIGVILAIDDFGTGMSSLAYIANLNVNVIKIDRAFIIDILTNRKHKAIVAATIRLSQALNCKMVAEGIEDEEQLLLLMKMGCEFGQGYYFSKPIPIQEMTEQLNNTIQA
ncbi:EAL domain-containing protein [Paraglaciecola aquimarina]|uniref:EAL domain-containing protein n=2 Tax=Paraglaciecola algarum TaxID=3050085 RepID=A0ABS9DAH6_9ALTE|nr:EAL domain-containing protein [Paraglaciecola sp. G1-23]